MNLDRLKSDGTPEGTALNAGPEERAIAGEELWFAAPSAAGVTVTERTALQLSALLAALNTLATDVAVLPIDCYQRQTDGSRRLDRQHPVNELLSRSPNGETTPLRWKQALMGHALEYGNGYAEIQRKGRGTPYGLHLLDPSTTCPKRVAGKLVYDLGNGRTLEPANVLHVAGFGFDGLTGYNFVRLLSDAIGVGLGEQAYAADYFANGSEPGGVIETPHKLGKPGRDNLAEGWAMRHGGPGKRHKVAVLEQDAKWKATSTDPEKSQLIEARKFQVIDVIRPWRVPPHKAGALDNAHLANIEASNLDYLQTALMGWLKGIEEEFSFKLFTRAEWLAGYYLEHNVDALLRGDLLTRYQVHEIALRNGLRNRNEVRAKENENPIPPGKGGDLYTIQAQVVPLDQAGVAFAPKNTSPTPEPSADAQA